MFIYLDTHFGIRNLCVKCSAIRLLISTQLKACRHEQTSAAFYDYEIVNMLRCKSMFLKVLTACQAEDLRLAPNQQVDGPSQLPRWDNSWAGWCHIEPKQVD
jgi:hypothetical protein